MGRWWPNIWQLTSQTRAKIHNATLTNSPQNGQTLGWAVHVRLYQLQVLATGIWQQQPKSNKEMLYSLAFRHMHILKSPPPPTTTYTRTSSHQHTQPNTHIHPNKYTDIHIHTIDTHIHNLTHTYPSTLSRSTHTETQSAWAHTQTRMHTNTHTQYLTCCNLGRMMLGL